jgi:hypothetical protein
MQVQSKPSIAQDALPVKVSSQKSGTAVRRPVQELKREELVWKRHYWQHQMDLTAQMIGLLDEAILACEIRINSAAYESQL